MADFIVLAALILALVYWWDSQGVKQIAYLACRRYCEERGLQLLDEYIRLHRIWLKKDDTGQPRFWRSYLFEFSSTGVERYRGMVVTLGRVVIHIESDVYHVPDDE